MCGSCSENKDLLSKFKKNFFLVTLEVLCKHSSLHKWIFTAVCGAMSMWQMSWFSGLGNTIHWHFKENKYRSQWTITFGWSGEKPTIWSWVMFISQPLRFSTIKKYEKCRELCVEMSLGISCFENSQAEKFYYVNWWTPASSS